MKTRMLSLLWLALAAGTAALPARGEATRLDVLSFTSRALKNNPLGDPVTRRIAVFVPAQITNHTALPVVYYLPGFGGSSESVLKNPADWHQAADQLARDITPMLLVVLDGRDRWGGSQYLNSPAQGNYADYVYDEIVPFVESHYSVLPGASNRIIAGHSSGGFGALRLGMMKPGLFGAVVALSPDSDFNTSHLPLVLLPGVTNVPLGKIEAFMKAPAGSPLPTDGDLVYALALSAAYAPTGPAHPGEFQWLFDAAGHWRPEVWNQWLANDPLTLVTRNRHAFAPTQKIYLEGAAHDDYQANIGARKIYEVLAARHALCAFYEPPGHHNDHVLDRLQRGLAWVFNRPLRDIH